MMENTKLCYKNIVIGGMGLAGSTLCFNIIKNISDLTNNSHKVYLGTNLKYTEDNGGYMINIYKSHYYHPKFTSREFFNILVIRDLRDCTSSMIRKAPEKWEENPIAAADYNMGYYNSWKNKRYNTYFKYEEYKENPFKYVKDLIKLMMINLSDEQINEVIFKSENIINNNEITNKQNGIGWNKHLLTKKHATNSGKIGDYRSNLTDNNIKKIENKYSWFFEKYKY